MPIYPWTKEGAILITKAARYIVPAVITAVSIAAGAVAGYFMGKRRKRAPKADNGGKS